MHITSRRAPGLFFALLRLASLRPALFAIVSVAGGITAWSNAAEPTAPVNYATAIQCFEQTVEAELQRGIVSGVTVALVDDQRLVYARGFGFADKKRRVPSAPDTIYRAGSISKLFTALAAMQLVEQGRLDLDRPVTRFNPDFRIVNLFDDAKPVTLRQLMCHRSGLIRESPVGGYFDDTEPTLDQTVASIAACAQVYPPDTKTKYSNIGVSVVGQTVAKVSGERFETYAHKHLLEPIGMKNSAFLLNKEIKPRLAKGYLPVADGQDGFREIESPHFELGTIPAGNLYTTAEDLARFLSFVFTQGRAASGRLLKRESFAEMLTPQLTTEATGFGLGFSVGNFRGHKTVSHMGAVYGFTSSVSGMPQEKLGVVILCNDDIAVGPVRKLTRAALALLLEAKLGEKPPTAPAPLARARSELLPFAGDYESPSWWAKIEPGDGVLHANLSHQRAVLVPREPLKFEANGRLAHEEPVQFARDPGGQITGFTAMGQSFRRVDPKAVSEIPAEWNQFLGSYGPAFIPVIISVKHGHLYAMTENEYDNRLTPLNRTVFHMPPGLYTDEQLVFQSGSNGRTHSILLANMKLARRKR